MSTTWQTDSDTDDLRAMSVDVVTSRASAPAARSARDAARALCGVAGWITRATSMQAMQAAMAELARYEPAWGAGGLRALPVKNGYVDATVAMIASVASTLVPFFGAAAMRSAMAFWAVETDSAVWQTVAAA